MRNNRTARKTEVLPVPTKLAESKPVSPEAFNARLATGGAFSSTTIINSYLGLTSDPIMMLTTLQDQAQVINAGDMTQVENMLIGQAVALESMFADLALRAKKAQSLQVVQCLTQLALRSQAGSRATLQTLAEVKNPRQVAFVKQTNIAQTQQVNNDMPSPAHARKVEVVQNEVLVKEKHGSKKMDTRATKASGHADTNLVAVDAVDRAPKPNRKAKRLP